MGESPLVELNGLALVHVEVGGEHHLGNPGHVLAGPHMDLGDLVRGVLVQH